MAWSRNVLSRRVAVLPALLTFLLLGGCSDEGMRSTGQPQIHVDPEVGAFGQVPVGATETEVFTIANHGSADLLLTGVTISPASTAAFRITAEPATTTVPPGEDVEVEVTFSPTARGSYAADLVILCNDQKVGGKVVVPLQSQRIEGDIYSDPARLDFGSVQPDSERVLHADIVNAGSAAFDVDDVRLINDRPPNDFRILALGLCSTRLAPLSVGSEDSEPATLEADCVEAAGVITIEPGQRLRLKVAYQPTGGDVDEARLVLTTDLSRAAVFEVTLLGSEPSPRLAILPESLDFGPTPLTGASKELLLRNIGTGNLTLQGISLAIGNADFALVDAPARGTVLLGETVFCGRCVCACTMEGGDGEVEELTQDDITQLQCLRETDCAARCAEVEGRVEASPGASAACLEQDTHYDDRTITVSFTPKCGERGYLPSASKLYVKSNDRTAPVGGLQASLTGRLDGAGIDVQPPALDFQTVAGGEHRTLSFRVYNVGSQPLAVTLPPIEQAGGEFSLVPQGDLGAIPAGGNVEVAVTYTPSQAEGTTSTGEVTVEHDAACGGPLAVTLRGRVGGAPYCAMLVSPPQINYGTVAAGRAVPKTAQVRSIGTGSCKFVTAKLVGAAFGFPAPQMAAPDVFAITGQPAALIPPLDAPEVEVTYTPSRNFTDSHEAFLVITTANPDGSDPVDHNVHLRGNTGSSEIQVLPQELDFGLTTLGCASPTRIVTVYNVGLVNLTIDSITIQPPNAIEFEIVAEPNLPATVNRAVPAIVEVRYLPQDQGVDTADLVFTSDAQNGAEYRVPLRGEGTLETDVVDRFVQAEGAMVDVLFVIDDSGSMGDDQENLSRNFQHFVDAGGLLDPTAEVDFHLGVITTDLDGDDNLFGTGQEMGPDRGKLRGDVRIVTRDTPNFQQVFEDNLLVGADEAGAQESGLQTARDALDAIWLESVPHGNCANTEDCEAGEECVNRKCVGHNRGFLRDEASLEIVFLSDEEDQSPSQIDFYIDFYKSIKGFRNEGLLRCWAIVGDSPRGCQTNDGSAAAGERYIEVANATGGRFHSICDAEFAQAMEDIGHTAFSLRVQFFLTRVADPDTVVVEVDGRNVPAANNWSYDPDSNSVIFEEPAVPQPNQEIVVHYKARCFPR
ncbi:MAG: choice-of-anchor D domain-containing protein [Myxococcota bacterium]|jgi:hypothetical protein|nr:choice-of-anchor D domain-containing protein [Myxococcota bacterium]